MNRFFLIILTIVSLPVAELVKFCQEKDIPTLPFNEESIGNGRYIEEYDGFYQQLQ